MENVERLDVERRFCAADRTAPIAACFYFIFVEESLYIYCAMQESCQVSGSSVIRVHFQ